MTYHDCEAVRNVLPLLAGGRLGDVRARAAADHLRTCASCEEELAVLRRVAAAAPAVPAGLEARIAAAVRAAPATGRTRSGVRDVRGVRGVATAPLAVAATFAVALLGGALLYERVAGPDADGATTEVDATLVWAGGADDPLVQGAATLAELTDEELETLLAELEL